MSTPLSSHADAVIDPTEPSDRLQLIACRSSRSPGGRSAVTVEFSLPGDSGILTRSSEATSSPAGDLRLSALATIDALTAATSGAFTAELIGAKRVRAFDATIVVVALQARVEGRPRQLVGVSLVAYDEVKSVVFATLQAVNRVVSPLLVKPRPTS
jgi:hypothetical protein